jgi:dipeptidyl aminopeptidase/acylaminoacyl peptidase
MNKTILFIALWVCTSISLLAQISAKKKMSHEELISWKSIKDPKISNDGVWIAYTLESEEGDPKVVLWNATSRRSEYFDRADKPLFSVDNMVMTCTIHPSQDSTKRARRKKIKKEELPKDSVIIYHLLSGKKDTVPNVRNYTIGEKWSGWIALHLEPEIINDKEESNENTKVEPDSTVYSKKQKIKKENKDNGSKLLIKSYLLDFDTLVPFVLDYKAAEESPVFILSTTGIDSSFEAGVLLFHSRAREMYRLASGKAEYTGLNLDKYGVQAVWIANRDSTKAYVPPNELHYWSETSGASSTLFEYDDPRLEEGWIISTHRSPEFSESGNRLFFGISPPPLIKDTTLLDEEMVHVEVWHWNDPLLYTQQSVRAEREKKRSFDVVLDLQSGTMTHINTSEIPEVIFDNEKNGQYALIYDERPYLKESSWGGFPSPRDLYLIDIETGDKTLIGKNVKGNASFSAANKYVYWYSKPDSVWFSYNTLEASLLTLTDNSVVPFYDELNDVPDYPDSYGILGWSEDDKYVYLYDRFDIWQIDPSGEQVARNLTNGRPEQLKFRYIKLDKEETFIPDPQNWLLYVFNEDNKSSGYVKLVLEDSVYRVKTLLMDNVYYTSSVQKSKNSEVYLFSKERFDIFPDLYITNDLFSNSIRVSDANPQQKDYSWGTAELYEWTSLDGQKLKGLLYKPEGFRPDRKYPMIVNFYERSSDRLYRYNAPSPGRSTINYSFYVSRGYVIFNPDVPYREGYPGESAFNAVVPGVTALIAEGFIDKDRIGVQGHSWGGYQIAYLLTRTNIFRAAESGAPVVNMISAYGGIRWETGLSRMFQYEKTQSRIGGNIWEYPLRFIENSPIFTMDKVQTPVLIMHNDKDGHVPWYQGIEYFIALRRLGKPAWLLNYNEEPHWPLKLQNRKDFNIRMQQFFDHFLLDEPMPKWMSNGVPAIEKTIYTRYEFSIEKE